MVNSVYVALVRSAYRPGDDICGTVYLQLDEPVERANLTLTVEGVERTQWRTGSASAAGLKDSCLPPSNRAQQHSNDSSDLRKSIASRHSRVFSRLGQQGQPHSSSSSSPQPSSSAGGGCKASVVFFQAQSVLLAPSSQACDVQTDSRHHGHSRTSQTQHHSQQQQRPQQQQQLLAPGRHALPFAVRLPLGAPPSLALQQGAGDPVTGEPQPFSASIAYRATATLTHLSSITTVSTASAPSTASVTAATPPPSPLTSSATFTVLPRPPAPTGCRPCVRDQVEVKPHHPGLWCLGLGLLGARGCCRTSTATMGVAVRLDKDCYAPGEQVVVDVQADTSGCRPALSRCRVSLRRHLVAHGAGGEVVRASSVLSAVRLAGATATGRRNSWASSADPSVLAAAAAPAAAAAAATAATSVSLTDRGFRVSLPIPPAIATPTLLGQLVRVYYAVDVHFEGSAFVCDPRIRVLCPVHPSLEAAATGTALCQPFAVTAAATVATTAVAAVVSPSKLPADGACSGTEGVLAAEAVAVVGVTAIPTGGQQTEVKHQGSGAYRSGVGAEEAADKHSVPVQCAEQRQRMEQRPSMGHGQGRERLGKGRVEQRGSNSGLLDVLSAYSVTGRDQDH